MLRLTRDAAVLVRVLPTFALLILATNQRLFMLFYYESRKRELKTRLIS
jgi:hypothetical protein